MDKEIILRVRMTDTLDAILAEAASRTGLTKTGIVRCQIATLAGVPPQERGKTELIALRDKLTRKIEGMS